MDSISHVEPRTSSIHSCFFFFCTCPLQAITLLQGLIPNKDDKDGGGCSADHLEKLYVFVLMWSIGALLELEDRAKLQEFIAGHEDFTLNLPPLTPGRLYSRQRTSAS